MAFAPGPAALLMKSTPHEGPFGPALLSFRLVSSGLGMPCPPPELGWTQGKQADKDKDISATFNPLQKNAADTIEPTRTLFHSWELLAMPSTVVGGTQRQTLGQNPGTAL